MLNNENYFTVFGWMVTQLELKGNELLCYAIINGFSQSEDHWFVGSHRYLSQFTGASKRTICEVLKSLTEKGLLDKKNVVINGVSFTHYKVVPKTSLVVQKLQYPTEEIARGGIAEIANNNIYIDNKEDNLKPDLEKSGSSEISFTKRCENFISVFNQIRGTKFRVTDKVSKSLKSRLKDYSPKEILQALKNAMKDPYHVDNGFRYLTPEFILRSDKLEKFLNTGDQGKEKKGIVEESDKISL